MLVNGRHDCVLVAGGTGYVGGLICAGLVSDGTSVVVPSRSEGRLGELRRRLPDGPGKFVGVHAARPADAVEQIEDLAPGLSAVVAAIGGFHLGPYLVDMTEHEWLASLDEHLTAHFLAMQAYAPLIARRPDPTYLMINGAAASEPMARSGAICVTGAAQRMLTLMMAAEPIGQSVRFRELSIMAAVAGDQRNLTPAAEVTADQLFRAVTDALCSDGPTLCQVWPAEHS